MQNLVDANRQSKAISKLDLMVYFHDLPEVQEAKFVAFSDAAFNMSGNRSYRKSWTVTGVLAHSKKSRSALHPVDYCSTQQMTFSHSGYRDEILTCAEAE